MRNFVHERDGTTPVETAEQRTKIGSLPAATLKETACSGRRIIAKGIATSHSQDLWLPRRYPACVPDELPCSLPWDAKATCGQAIPRVLWSYVWSNAGLIEHDKLNFFSATDAPISSPLQRVEPDIDGVSLLVHP
jgi:hypothetical protein